MKVEEVRIDSISNHSKNPGRKCRGRPVGRPPIEIDYAACEKLARIMCTQSEIAEVLGVSLSTLEHDKEFLRIHKKGIEAGKASLRRMQWKSAEDGNVTSQIWLGKQYLGQRDKSEISGDGGGPVVLAVLKGVKLEDL
jgi:hypothetical protein